MLCAPRRSPGYAADGGLAEYAVVPEAYAYRIPPALGAAESTPLLCAGIIGYRALRRAEVKPGCRLGLYGFGASAHIAIQVARHLGCAVYVMTRDPRHQSLARELGETGAGGVAAAPPARIDSAILFAPVGYLAPLAQQARGGVGTLAAAGIDMSRVPPLDYERQLFHEKNLRSVTANTRADGEELLRLAAEIPIRPRTVSFPLADANRALYQLKHGAIRGAGVLVF